MSPSKTKAAGIPLYWHALACLGGALLAVLLHFPIADMLDALSPVARILVVVGAVSVLLLLVFAIQRLLRKLIVND